MKRSRNRFGPINGRRPQAIRLQFAHPIAAVVRVAGTFNNWRPGATPMVPMGGGRWLKELVLAPGVYEYRFVVDGEWMPDPQAGDTVADPAGEMNSVLIVDGRKGCHRGR